MNLACDKLFGLEVVAMTFGSPFPIGITRWIESKRCLCEDGLAMDM